MSDVTTSSNGDHQLSIILEFPWGSHHLETVTLHMVNQTSGLWDNFHIHNQKVNTLNSTPAVLTCEAVLDLAVFAYLANSFSEKWRGGETKNVGMLFCHLSCCYVHSP